MRKNAGTDFLFPMFPPAPPPERSFLPGLHAQMPLNPCCTPSTTELTPLWLAVEGAGRGAAKEAGWVGGWVGGWWMVDTYGVPQ